MNNIDDIIKLADNYFHSCNEELVKLARIRKLPNGKYRVVSQKGKNLGTCNSREAAKKRLRQVEYFKHFDHSNADDSDNIIDLTDADDFTYSAMTRKIREKGSKEQVRDFLKIFKAQFDKVVKQKTQKPEKVALQNTMLQFNKIHKIKIDKKLVKNAAIAELGNAAQVGAYLAGIVRFTISGISPEKRGASIDNLKKKIYYLDENEISIKNMPQSAALGQAITFVKHVLLNQDASYIREVLNNLVRNL